MPVPFIVKSAKGLSFKSTKKANFVARVSHKFMMRKARIVWGHIGTFVAGKKVLDVGMGSGTNNYFLKKKGFETTGIDVDNLSIYSDLKPVVYDGENIPFKKNEFDTAVIVHVLHHCNDGVQVLKEAKRVAKRVILVEDTFRNKFEELVIGSNDAFTNFEFWWHKYRKVAEWKRIIKKNDWKVVAFDQWSEVGVTSIYGRYCMFVIE